MQYQKITLVLCICGVLFASACNNEKSDKKDPVESKQDAAADRQSIRQLMETYNNHFLKGEFEAMTSYVYPPIFEDFSKENMIESMKASMHPNGFDIQMQTVTIDSISPVFVEGKGKYALGTHNAKALYQFGPNEPLANLRVYCINYSGAFGNDNVVCDFDKKNFMITMSDISFFIYSDSLQKWYTLGTSSPETLKKFIPAGIRTQMGLRDELIGE